jgi:dCTP deaminase
MILSNSAIFEALDAGDVVIQPEPSPRFSTALAKSPYQTSAVDLCLGETLAYVRDGLAVNVDLRRGRFDQLFVPNSTTVTISEEQPFALEKGRLVLGRTREFVDLPIRPGGRCFAARVEGKSSFARCGLLVHFTAPTVHAGFRGHITLELMNLGPLPILLFPNMPICQLVLEEVSGQPIPNDSQFHGQTHPGGPAGNRPSVG